MKVKIKTWEQMEQEFGLDSDGDIGMFPSFTTDMEDSLPENRVIEVTAYLSDVFQWSITKSNKQSSYVYGRYLITPVMVEPIIGYGRTYN